MFNYKMRYCPKLFKNFKLRFPGNLIYNAMNFPMTRLSSSIEYGLRRFASNPYFSKLCIAGLEGDPVITIALPLNPNSRSFFNVSMPPMPPFMSWSRRMISIKIFL